jgi:glycine betaine/proline transport system substrate-binding protein
MNNSYPMVVRLGVTDLSFHRVTGALISLLLTRMGFTVERHYAPHAENFERLRDDQIDLIASAWIPFSHGEYQRRVEEVVPTRQLGLHYEPYALWGVPDYIPAADVSEVADLLKPEVFARMRKRIQGIGAGAGITRFSLKMMDEYGLAAAGYEFFAGSQEACIGAFESAVKEQQWAVVPLWWPQFLHHRHHIRELRDPRGLLGGVDKAVLLAREDRLLQLFTPAQVEILDRVRLSNQIVSELDYAVNREGKNYDEAVEDWLSAHDALLRHWLG